MAYLRGCSVFSCLDSPTWNPLLILMLLGHPGPQWLSGECELCGPYPEVLPGVPGKGLLALLSLPWAIHCVHFYSILRLMPLTKWLRMYIYKIYFSFGVIRGTGNSDMKRKKKKTLEFWTLAWMLICTLLTVSSGQITLADHKCQNHTYFRPEALIQTQERREWEGKTKPYIWGRRALQRERVIWRTNVNPLQLLV